MQLESEGEELALAQSALARARPLVVLAALGAAGCSG